MPLPTFTALRTNLSNGQTGHTADSNTVHSVVNSLPSTLADLANTYRNAVTGTRYTILYNGTAWPASRPHGRTDIYFDLVGGAAAVADPAWMLNGDAREVTA